MKYILFGKLEDIKINLVKKWVLKNKGNIVCGIDNGIEVESIKKEGIEWFNPKNIELDNTVKYILLSKSHAHDMNKQLQEKNIDKQNIYYFDYMEELYSEYYKTKIQNACTYREEQLVPTELSLELSSACNLNCIYCPYHSQYMDKEKHIVSKNLSAATLTKIISQLKDVNSIKTLSIGTNGEIFINTNWYEYIQEINKELKLDKVRMLTNGSLLDENNINKIIALSKEIGTVEIAVSIDGQNSSENELFRRGSIYKDIKENTYKLKLAMQRHSRENIILSITNVYIPTVEERHKKYERPEHLKGELADIPIFDTMAINFKNDVEKGMLENGYDKLEVEKSKKNECTEMMNVIGINSSGEIIACCCGNAAKRVLGNVWKENCIDVWRNMLRNEREEIKEQKVPEICETCKFNNKNTENIFLKKKL